MLSLSSELMLHPKGRRSLVYHSLAGVKDVGKILLIAVQNKAAPHEIPKIPRVHSFERPAHEPQAFAVHVSYRLPSSEPVLGNISHTPSPERVIGVGKHENLISRSRMLQQDYLGHKSTNTCPRANSIWSQFTDAQHLPIRRTACLACPAQAILENRAKRRFKSDQAQQCAAHPVDRLVETHQLTSCLWAPQIQQPLHPYPEG